ncbi:MAG: FHA domain-containing protein [Lachnospiraceae bacterium]|nr:FHA domain-containing protein [Lachnospiraceae bacterium]
MEAEFKREMNRNYLILRPGKGKSDTYTTRMLSEHSIPGLLSFHEKQINQEIRFYYDITSKQPLERILENRSIHAAEVRRMLTDLVTALRQLERFLLDESQICLNPSFIYVEPDSFQCFLCLIPGLQESFSESFSCFSQYLLDHVDQNDGEAVVLAFGIFRQSRKENFGMEDIERELQKTEGKRAKTEESWQSEKAGQGEGKRTQIPDRQQSGTGRKQEWHPEQQEKQNEADTPEETLPYGMKANWKILGAAGGFLVFIPIAVFLLFGIDGLIQYKWLIGAAELVIPAGIMLGSGLGQPKAGGMDTAEYEVEKAELEVLFREDYEKEGGKPEGVGPDFRKNGMDEGDIQTMLLTAHPIVSDSHRLHPLEGGEEIAVNYFPFLIGKNKDICDFCPDAPGISRLHLKIEETKEGYRVTDLNSTNGTSINGRLLQTNESCPLQSGDTIGIADTMYQFQ